MWSGVVFIRFVQLTRIAPLKQSRRLTRLPRNFVNRAELLDFVEVLETQAMAKRKPIYKIVFVNEGKVFEIYAKQVSQGAMFGFVEIEGLTSLDHARVGMALFTAGDRLK